MTSILIVEDDPQIRSMLQETLELEGFETFAAQNGNEALQLYEQSKPDAIITDILMPEKEGLSFITDLRKADRKVCVIAISGGALQLSPQCNLELAKMFGANYTFEKPLDIDAMLDVLNEALGQKKS